MATAIGADRELAAGTQLPALLPYLCDRSPQMTEFRDAFHRSLGGEGSGQPLVVLVHGDEREAHSRFLERVKVHVIPKLYQPVGRRTAALSPVRLDWPADLVEREQFNRRMEGMLADRLEVPPTREAVLKRLAATPGLVFAEIQMLTSECRRSGADTLAHFVGFWDELLTKAPVPLMVALSVKYTRSGLFSMGLRSFNARVTARLNQLALERWQAVRVKLLPELKAVVQSDALSWADHEDIRRHCKRSLEPEIRKLYDGWGDTEGMPMEDLAERLTENIRTTLTAGDQTTIDLYKPGTRPPPSTGSNRDLNWPSHYIAEQGLIDAVNVALLLGQPLLVTGAPGTGKTQLAYSVAWELLGTAPLKFEVKSTTIARDLFYTYDALTRFQAAQSGTKTDPLDHFKVNALGLAIVLSQTSDKGDLRPREFVNVPAQRSVVLIDEIDKAPRDFPNDLLNEIENLYFKIPELGTARCEPRRAPADRDHHQQLRSATCRTPFCGGASSSTSRSRRNASRTSSRAAWGSR